MLEETETSRYDGDRSEEKRREPPLRLLPRKRQFVHRVEGEKEEKKKKERTFLAAPERSKLAAISEIGKKSRHVPFDEAANRLDSVFSSPE